MDSRIVSSGEDRYIGDIMGSKVDPVLSTKTQGS